MRFITEDDLRDLYRTQPFTDYDLKEGERLTPGARQFLVDRGVDMYDRKTGPVHAVRTGGRTDLVIENRFEALKIGFLMTAKDVMAADMEMSRELISLCRKLTALEKGGDCDISCTPCSGFHEDNFSSYAGDCFEMDDFILQVERGREILLLADLRRRLRGFVLEMEEMIPEKKCRERLISGLNRITNTLTQMICRATGGKECQRKD